MQYFQLYLVKNYTYFGQIYCPSSGVLADGNITSMTNTYCCEYFIKTPDDGQ